MKNIAVPSRNGRNIANNLQLYIGKFFKGQICAVLRITVLHRSVDMPPRSAEKNYKNLRRFL